MISLIIAVYLFLIFFAQRTLLNIQDLSMMELNFEGMKRILTTPSETTKQAELEKEKREQLAKRLKEDDFDDLMQFTESSVSIRITSNLKIS
jgi:hypothetical protein